MQLPLNGTELGYHSLLRRVTPDDERAILAFPTEVGKAEEGECFRLPFSPLFPVLGGKAPQLDQPRLFCIDFQTELRQPLLESFPEPFDIHSAFEADDQIIGIENDDDIAACHVLTPGFYPQIEEVMQVDVG